MTTTEVLAEFVVRTQSSAIPAEVATLSQKALASTLASAAAGFSLDSTTIVRTLALDRGGRADASIWFTNERRLPLAGVAQANALASDAAASDDTDLRDILHAGTPSSAASLAAAECYDRSGADVVTAIALGYQVSARLTAAMSPGFRQRGFHACVGAVFAATVSSARLASLSEAQVAHAIALSATSVGGLIAAADTSWSREYHAGLATLLGVDAMLAAQRGYQGELSILEAPMGFFECFGGTAGTTASTRAIDGIASSWDIVSNMAIKLAPGGHTYHAIAEAAASAVSSARIGVDEVARIEVSRPGVTALSGPLHPVDLVGVAHSPAYFAAAGVADGGIFWSHASPAKINDATIHRLIDLVAVVDPPPSEEAERFRMGATVTVRASDGRAGSATVYSPKGSAERGIEWSDVDQKYRSLVAAIGIDAGRVEASLMLLHDLGQLERIGELTALLRPDAP